MKPQIGKRKLKPSGIDWIGDVPEGWGVVPVKYLTTCNDEVLPENVDSYYEFDYVEIGDVKYERGITSSERVVFRDAPSRARRVVRKNDVIISTVRTYLKAVASIGDFDFPLIVSTGFAVLRATEVFYRYLYYAVLSQDFQSQVSLYSKGVSYPAITSNSLLHIPIRVPSLNEQKRIAAKLDRLCGRVDELAANLTKEIAALQDYRKSLITECVTKGLNPKAKMKPSGVEWIGKIPAGWTVMRLKYACSTITDGSHFSPECVDDGYPYVTATDVRGVGIDFERTKFVSEADYQALVATGCGLKRDDVLMVKDGATTGRVGMMTDDTKAVALSSVAILRTPEDTDRKFLYWGLQSDGLQRNIQQTMAGSAMPRITVWKLGQYNIALPSIDEQKEIVAYLDKHCAAIDAKIEERKGQLEKLAEYRSSAIYEYVTGKKEVAA